LFLLFYYLYKIIILTFFISLSIRISAENKDDMKTPYEDIFNKLIMISTKTLPTATNNPTLTTRTKLLPTNIESDGKTSTEIVYDYLRKVLTTRLPEDVDDAFATCITFRRDAFCDYGMNCYKSYDTFTTGGPTTCTIYTLKTNDTPPSNNDYVTQSSICHPKPYTITSTIDIATYTTTSLTTFENKGLTEIFYNTVYDLETTIDPDMNVKRFK